MPELSLADAAIIFAGAFTVVFLLGLQSRNVVAGRYLAAVKYAASGSLAVLGISTLGGCLGIAGAIWFYGNVMERRK